MAVKKIGNIERALYCECVSDVPDFGRISKLFDMGADINAVNEYGESLAALIFEGYCGGGETIRSGKYVPELVRYFVSRGFDVKRGGLRLVSELQNSIYDKYVRESIVYILKLRRNIARNDLKNAKKHLKSASVRICKKVLSA